MYMRKMIYRFRELPTPLLVTAVASRFVFGLGLGALLAGKMPRRHRKLFGKLMMAVAVAMVCPVGRQVWRKKAC